MRKFKYHYKLLICILLVILIIILSCTMGSANLSILDSIKIILSKIPFINNLIDTSDIGEQYFKIVLNIRLPRILTALFTGTGLAVAGVIFQGVFRNPMADPYMLGISSGAVFGVTLSIILPIGITVIGISSHMVFAFIFALLTIVFVFRISSFGNKSHVHTMLLSGIAMNYLFSAFTTILLVYNRHTLEKVYFWTLGSFNSAHAKDLYVIIPVVIICSFILFTQSKALNILLIGEKDATSLGVDIKRLKKLTILITSLMLCVIISFSGAIGFVGLIIPHISRFFVGANHKKLIPMSALIGGIFLVICDTAARTLFAPKELSVGIITSLMGAPFFIYLLATKRNVRR